MQSGCTSSKQVSDLSDFQAWVNITKSGMGLAFLTMPSVVGKVGFIPGFVVTAVVFAGSLWLTLLIKTCKDKVEHRENVETDPLRMAEASLRQESQMNGGLAWDSGMGYFDEVMCAAFGQMGRSCAVLGVLLVQIFTGVLYVSTIAESVPASFPEWSRNRVLLAVAIICSIMSLTDRLRRVAWLSTAAALTYLVVFALLVYEGSKHRQTTQVKVSLWKGTGYDYGPLCAVASFLFSSFVLTDCVHREMSNKDHFVYVTTAGYLAMLVGGLCFGFVGYACYGGEAEDLIYLNFPSSSRLLCVLCVSAILSVSIILNEVPIFLFLQAQLPNVPHAIVNISVVSCVVFIAYLLPDIMTILDTFQNVADIFVLWIMPAACFFKLSNRYERFEQFWTAASVLLGIVVVVVGFASS
mmetsp:Transcript_73256/g.136907  ORF Transcript_73256/g.136907 Transcript_73256/m.136907 type:complete len:410 (+) Transcript_73256:67-1296(+)